MKVTRTGVLLLLLVMTVVHQIQGLWPWDDIDDEDIVTTNSPEEDDEHGEGSGDIILIDGETPSPTRLSPSTVPTTLTIETVATTTTTVPTAPTTTATSTAKDTPSPRTRAIEEEITTIKPPLSTHSSPWRLPPATEHSGRSRSLHRDAIILQRNLDSCPYCMRRQDPVMMCPAHQVAVEIDTWAKQLHSVLSQGCSMGPLDQEKCCLHGDSRVLETLREVTHRLRDVYHVLETSCSKCPKHGGFSEWTEWSLCTKTCGSGTRIRTRSCNNPPPKNGGRTCEGHTQESTHCQLAEAPLNGGWGQWESWSSCSASCGDGTRMRIRACNSPPPNSCGQKCVGSDLQSEGCYQQTCCSPVMGNWSPWAQWSLCSVTCGVGNRERIRTCTNPTPNQCGQNCVGADREQTGCYAGDCCSDGVWGEWSSWSTCSVTCGSDGVRERARRCDSPAPNWCGQKCPGQATESTSCNCKACCEDGVWGTWGSWSACSVTCGPGGLKERSRLCDSPSPNWCGKKCPGQRMESTSCESQPCACNPDQWSTWGPWSQCSASCGEGLTTRSRACVVSSSNPCRQGCSGQNFESRNCGGRECCDPDRWSTWGPWSQCSASCGEGLTTRSRACVVSSSNPCRKGCSGQNFERRNCGEGECCAWSRWSEWTGCSVTCTTSQQPNRVRTRSCVTTADQRRPCARPQRCRGARSQAEKCLVPQCRPPATWGHWKPWCPCNCRRGVTSRLRTCEVDGNEVDNSQCQGEAKQEVFCDVRKENICPDCITSCADKKDGTYPSCNGCSFYILCQYNRATVRRCQSNFQWDTHKFQCAPPPSESCSLKEPVTSCQEAGADGLYHSEGGCGRYLQCLRGRGSQRSCPSRQEFNAHSQKCETAPSPTCIRQLQSYLMAPLLRYPLQDRPIQILDEDEQSDDNDNKKKKERKNRRQKDRAAGNTDKDRPIQNLDEDEQSDDIDNEKKKERKNRRQKDRAAGNTDKDRPVQSLDEDEQSDDNDNGKKNKKKSKRQKDRAAGNTDRDRPIQILDEDEQSDDNGNGKKKERKNRRQKDRAAGNTDKTSRDAERKDSDTEKRQTKNPRFKPDAKDADDATLKKTRKKKRKSQNMIVEKNHLENDESLKKKKTARQVVPDVDTSNTSDTKAAKIRHSTAKARHDNHHNHSAEEQNKETTSTQKTKFPCYANCQGLQKGRKYQSCQGCRFYLFCSFSGSAQIRRCHGKRVWDGISQRCRRHSRTCGLKTDSNIPIARSQESDSSGNSDQTNPSIFKGT